MTMTYNALTHEEFEERVRKVSPDLKILGRYTGCDGKVLVEDQYGLCNIRATGLWKARPTIESAIDKTSYWLNKVGLLHGGKYDYSKMVYVSNHRKVIIICPEHGEFLQRPSSHVKNGCCQCAKENTKGGHGGLNLVTAERKKDEWENKPAYVYHIKLNSENESFYKVGITTQDLQKRFGNLTPYTYEVLNYVTTNLYEAVKLERSVLELTKDCKYLPSVKFDGYTECFSTTVPEINDILLSYTNNSLQPQLIPLPL